MTDPQIVDRLRRKQIRYMKIEELQTLFSILAAEFTAAEQPSPRMWEKLIRLHRALTVHKLERRIDELPELPRWPTERRR